MSDSICRGARCVAGAVVSRSRVIAKATFLAAPEREQPTRSEEQGTGAQLDLPLCWKWRIREVGSLIQMVSERQPGSFAELRSEQGGKEFPRKNGEPVILQA